MKSSPLIGMLVLIALAAGAFMLFGRSTTDTSAGRDMERLSHIALTDLNGNPTTLAAWEGTPLIINAWAVWCPFCRKEIPDFATLQQELGERATVIAIDRAESSKTVIAYLAEIGVAHDAFVFLLDPDDSFYKSVGGFSMPETLLVSADGDIVFHKRGPLTLEEMRAAVEKYLP